MTESTATRPEAPGAGDNLLLSRYGAVAMLGIAGIAAWQGFGLPVFLAGIILALTAVTRGWSRAALIRLDYANRLGSTRAFPGDRVECEAELDNRKALPLVWVNVSEPVEADIAPDPETLPPGMTLADGRIGVDTSLMWYQRARWRYRLECRRRGYYRFGPASITSSDLFGVFHRTRRAADSRHLAVFPRIFPLGDLGLPSNFPLGGVRSLNPLFQDPIQVRGIRDYTPEIPFRHIHWKASARTGHLQAKVFDPTCSLQLSLLVDATRLAKTASEGDDGDFELALSTAASLAWHFNHRGSAVGLFANTRLADGAHSAAVRPSARRGHLADILLALAKAETACLPFPKLLDIVGPGLASGGSLAVITGGLDRDSERRLVEMRARGFPVCVFLIGAEAAAPGPFPVHRIVRPADVPHPV
jgi:uncharacterized protein (DUF58 family)